MFQTLEVVGEGTQKNMPHGQGKEIRVLAPRAFFPSHDQTDRIICLFFSITQLF